MSLLMDALKRAEKSKQEAARRQGGKEAAPAPGDNLSLEPIAAAPAAAAGSRSLPDLAAHLEAVDADLASSAQARPAAAEAPPAFARTEPAGPAIARNAFAAKQLPVASRNNLLWLVLGTLAIAGLAIGAYVWFQVSTMSGSSLAPAASRPPLASSEPPSPLAAAPTAPTAPPPASLPAASESPPAVERESRLPPPASEPAPLRTAPAMRAVPAGEPIRLARTQPQPDPSLNRAHAHLQEGKLDLASQNFLQALQYDPNNIDALLALAAIAQHQGRANEAEGWRQRALIADPSDPAAQAATLGGLAASTDPQTTESRLKTLLAGQPQSAPLNFTLGNLYARQQRWAEAQQVYFNAVAADADNPDYLFNLAVSLDHLRQVRPAAQHYRLALEAAGRRPATFDPAQVGKRLAELSP